MHRGLILGLIKALPITSPRALISYASIDFKKKKKHEGFVVMPEVGADHSSFCFVVLCRGPVGEFCC